MKETGPEWSTEHPELPHAERPVIPDGILARPVPEVGPCSPAAILSGSLGGRVKRRQAARHTEGLAKCARDTYNAPPLQYPRNVESPALSCLSREGGLRDQSATDPGQDGTRGSGCDSWLGVCHAFLVAVD